ncbi:MAG: YncE family protein [Geobacteraceae bacterium]
MIRRFKYFFLAMVAAAGLLLGGCGDDDAVVEIPSNSVGVVAFSNGWMGIIDTATQTVSGPFLAGELGNSGGGLLDVVITPDYKTALISNFGDTEVFIVDISKLSAPVALGSVTLSFFAEDMALTPDGRFALVSDGGFSPRIAVIDVKNAVLVEEYTSPDLDPDPVNTSYDTYFNSIAVAADGKTVLAADYFTGKVHTLTINDAGHLTFVGSIDVTNGGTLRPVNVTIAPNGKTALVAVVASDPDITDTLLPADHMRFPVLEITAPGVVVLKSFVATTVRIIACQSIVFNSGSSKAYVLCNQEDPDTTDAVLPNNAIIELSVDGTGAVSDSGYTTVVDFIGTSQLFGVDTLAFDRYNNYLYVSNMTLSGAKSHLQVVDVQNRTVVKTIDFADVEMPPGGGVTMPALPTGVYIR